MGFLKPERRILSPMNMKQWTSSQGYRDYTEMLDALSRSVKGKKISDAGSSQNTELVLRLLDKLNGWIDEIPPVDQPQRFGNKAYRTWHERLTENASSLITEMLGEHPGSSGSEVELSAYLLDSFGNSTRIDYGTGHEACFAFFLCCLFKLKFLVESDSSIVVLKVFERYLRLCRKLQLTYKMEPAGSQGVWSLDDYQFLPFFFGSSQLIDHPRLEPQSFTDEHIVRQFSGDYMLMGAVAHILDVKTGPFAEHSNQLWNISSVPFWSKVNTGLMKMYKAEVEFMPSATEVAVRSKIEEQLKPSHLEIEDFSDGCGLKLNAVIVSEAFEGKSLLQRHRLVNEIIAEEMKSIHAFTMKTLTPKQWTEKQSA